MKLSELVAILQADIEANGDTDEVALCIAVGRGSQSKPYAHRLDAFGEVQILRDSANYPNGMAYLVADYSGDGMAGADAARAA